MIGCLRTLMVFRPLVMSRSVALMSRAAKTTSSKPGVVKGSTPTDATKAVVQDVQVKEAKASKQDPAKQTVPATLKTNIGSRLGQFTSPLYKKDSKGKAEKVPFGRAWRSNELRLKSNLDLHKLWYVLLKEKNAVMSGMRLYRQINSGSKPRDFRIIKLKLSMARLLTVLGERSRLRQEYRRVLEDEYITKKKAEELELYKAKKEEYIHVPEVTSDLLRAKYKDLQKGVDTLGYIKEALELERKKRELKSHIANTYDYKNKPIVDEDYQLKEGQSENDVIRRFKSQVLNQLNSGDNTKVPFQEILTQHVKNWKQLNMKQRRVVLNFINARRARESKSEFLKELSLLGQKIAHDNIQDQLAKTASVNK